VTIDENLCTPEDKRTLVTILAEMRSEAKELKADHDNTKVILGQHSVAIDTQNAAIEKQNDVHDIFIKKIDAIYDTQLEYLPLLKDITNSRKDSHTLHRGIVEKSIVGIVWGAIVFVGLSAWHYVKLLLAEGPPG